MREFLKKYSAPALMFLIVAAVCLMFSCRKSGMFIDEIYTYGLSNSSYAAYITDVKGGSALDKVITRQELFDYVAVTTGGSPRGESLHYLEQLSHRIETPVPSLFTFNVPDPSLRKLMGTVVEPATASIPGTKFRQSGALLITHWGLSGPAILKLSSHAARHLHENSYKSPVLINWTNETNTETVVNALQTTATQHSQKFITGIHPFGLPSRLWIHLIDKCSIPRERKWGEIGQKGIRRLADTLCNDRYEVDGRSTFREEFVTCGGISLESVHRHSLESKSCPGLYFAGEVLDIDGVTGGFNFQAAWSTAHAVAQDIAKKQSDLDNEDIQPTSK